MDRTQKHAFVADFQARLSNAETVIIAHYRGLTVKNMQELRRTMRAEGAEVQVAKNRLAKIAMADTPFKGIADMLTGPTAIAFSSDPVAPAKIAQAFAKDHEKWVIIGGAMGEKRLEAADVKALASMPSLDELRGKLVGLVQAPAQQLVGLSQAPAGQIARLVAQKPESAAA